MFIKNMDEDQEEWVLAIGSTLNAQTNKIINLNYNSAPATNSTSASEASASSSEVHTNALQQENEATNPQLTSAATSASTNEPSTSSPSNYNFENLPILKFIEGDIIRIIARNCGDGGKYGIGTVLGRQESVGKFPLSLIRPVIDRDYLEEIAESGEPLPTTASQKQSTLADLIRNKVSKKKRRYQKDCYDLDLAYVTPRIIAMGFPSEKLEGLYRNPMSQVQHFLTTRHLHRAKIYNLCSERSYPPERFEHYARYPFDDHNPSEFTMIEPFCEDVHAWLSSHPDNIVCVHCKAGKGRTGFLIACYMLYAAYHAKLTNTSNYPIPTPSTSPSDNNNALNPLPLACFDAKFDNASTALRYYACKRTRNARGVTIPSQIRYAYYWQLVLQGRLAGNTNLFAAHIVSVNPFLLVSIRMHGFPYFVSVPANIHFVVNTKNTHYSSKGKITIERRKAEDYCIFAPKAENGLGITPLDGDTQVIFYHGRAKMFQFWLNTNFFSTTSSTAGGCSCTAAAHAASLVYPKNPSIASATSNHHSKRSSTSKEKKSKFWTSTSFFTASSGATSTCTCVTSTHSASISLPIPSNPTAEDPKGAADTHSVPTSPRGHASPIPESDVTDATPSSSPGEPEEKSADASNPVYTTTSKDALYQNSTESTPQKRKSNLFGRLAAFATLPIKSPNKKCPIHSNNSHSMTPEPASASLPADTKDADDPASSTRVTITKCELDKACKDLKHKLYPAHFRMELVLQYV